MLSAGPTKFYDSAFTPHRPSYRDCQERAGEAVGHFFEMENHQIAGAWSRHFSDTHGEA